MKNIPENEFKEFVDASEKDSTVYYMSVDTENYLYEVLSSVLDNNLLSENIETIVLAPNATLSEVEKMKKSLASDDMNDEIKQLYEKLNDIHTSIVPNATLRGRSIGNSIYLPTISDMFYLGDEGLEHANDLKACLTRPAEGTITVLVFERNSNRFGGISTPEKIEYLKKIFGDTLHLEKINVTSHEQTHNTKKTNKSESLADKCKALF